MVAAPGAGAARLGLEGGVHIGARGEPRRHEAEEDAGAERDEEGEREDPRIEAELERTGGAADDEAAVDDPVETEGERDAEQAARAREQDGLDELLPDEMEAGGPEGGADGELAQPGGGAGELEVGEVGAGDEQYEAGEAQQHPGDALAERVEERAVQRHGGAAQAGVGFRILLRLRGDHGRELGVDPRRRHAGGEAPDELERAVVAPLDLVAGEVERAPERRAVPERAVVEDRRHDADDRDDGAVEPEGAADDIAGAGVALLPEAVAEQDDVGAARLELLGGEGAAEQRRDAEGGEEIRGHGGGAEALGGLAGFGEAEGDVAERGEAGEARATVADLAELHVRVGACAAGGGAGDHLYELLGFREGRGAEEQGVDQREHRGVHADAQSEGEQGDGGVARRLGEGAGGLAEQGQHGGVGCVRPVGTVPAAAARRKTRASTGVRWRYAGRQLQIGLGQAVERRATTRSRASLHGKVSRDDAMVGGRPRRGRLQEAVARCSRGEDRCAHAQRYRDRRLAEVFRPGRSSVAKWLARGAAGCSPGWIGATARPGARRGYPRPCGRGRLPADGARPA